MFSFYSHHNIVTIILLLFLKNQAKYILLFLVFSLDISRTKSRLKPAIIESTCISPVLFGFRHTTSAACQQVHYSYQYHYHYHYQKDKP